MKNLLNNLSKEILVQMVMDLQGKLEESKESNSLLIEESMYDNRDSVDAWLENENPDQDEDDTDEVCHCGRKTLYDSEHYTNHGECEWYLLNHIE